METGQVFAETAYHEIRYGLYDPTLEYAGAAWGRDVMQPWAAANQPILAALHQAGRAEMASVVFEAEQSWALYALSRLTDVLILPLEPPSTDPQHPQDWVPVQAYGEFVAAIGGASPVLTGFHPFLHEIVAVQSADDPRTPPELVKQWWPACMVGSLLLMRAGVTVRAGADHLDPRIAATSPLYWASRRRYRPAIDLSHGWGSNSLWRTSFRRDYRLPDRLLYNVDAALDPKPEHPGGMPFNRDVDLLRYRCSTLVEPDEEQWVWENHYTEPRPAGL